VLRKGRRSRQGCDDRPNVSIPSLFLRRCDTVFFYREIGLKHAGNRASAVSAPQQAALTPSERAITMLIPNAKFLVLPLVAVVIIAALPSSDAGSSQKVAGAVIVSATTTDCGQRISFARCLVTAKVQDTVAR
jgi:hypothetical protein